MTLARREIRYSRWRLYLPVLFGLALGLLSGAVALCIHPNSGYPNQLVAYA